MNSIILLRLMKTLKDTTNAHNLMTDKIQNKGENLAYVYMDCNNYSLEIRMLAVNLLAKHWRNMFSYY